MNKNNKTVIIVGIMLLVASIPMVSADRQSEINTLTDFIAEDTTDRHKKTGLSSAYVYYLARNASYHNISLGMAKFYNNDIDSGWTYAYYITSEGDTIFIGSLSDKIMGYSKACRMIGHDVYNCKVTYFHTYPYINNVGYGPAPEWLIRGYQKHSK